LARLYERQGAIADAISTYESGIKLAHQTGERHALNELRMALDDLVD